MLLEDPVIPQIVAFDDQIYRIIAIQLIKQLGLLERASRRIISSRPSSPGNVIDRLVDFIATTLNTPLSLTDLEDQSGYSARRLQQLFRERFDCTPMQDVRRQRLQLALNRLEQPDAGETITSIARSLGYRQVRQFSADFRREFGYSPSEILRTHRAMITHGDAGL